MKMLISSFFMSCFSYCPLIWTFCSKAKNNKINSMHKKALKILTPNQSDMNKLLAENNMVKIHTRNLQAMMTEVYCCLKHLNPSFLWNEVILNEKHTKSRNGSQLILPQTRTLSYGMKSFSFRGSMLWNYLPKYFKESASLSIFKKRIKNWIPDKCQCNLCTS